MSNRRSMLFSLGDGLDVTVFTPFPFSRSIDVRPVVVFSNPSNNDPWILNQAGTRYEKRVKYGTILFLPGVSGERGHAGTFDGNGNATQGSFGLAGADFTYDNYLPPVTKSGNIEYRL